MFSTQDMIELWMSVSKYRRGSSLGCQVCQVASIIYVKVNIVFIKARATG